MFPRMGRQNQARRHREPGWAEPSLAAADHHDQVRCALCGRPIPPQAKSSKHHLVPKLKGGTHLGTVRLHQICHSAIHARYTEAEIARRLADPALLRDDPELARFVAWVRTKPDDFHAPTRTARGRTAKWK